MTVRSQVGTIRRLILTDRPFETARGFLQNRLLLTPNERAASALRGAAAENQSLAGLAEERLAGAGWRMASEVAQLINRRRAIRETALLSEESVSMAALGSSVRELLRAGLSRDEDIAARLRSSEALAARTMALIGVAQSYRKSLAEDQLVDPAEALWRAAELGLPAVPVLVAGYPRGGSAELAFLDSIAAAGSVFVLPAGFVASEAAAAVLGDRGWQVERIVEPTTLEPTAAAPTINGAAGPAISTARIHAYRLPNQEDEVRYVLSDIKRLLRDGIDRRAITLIARDEQAYGPLVAAVAEEYRVPLKRSYAVPLRSTRLGELLAGLSVALVDGLPFEATARLLSQPLIRALAGASWAAARAAHPVGAAAWGEITAAASLLDWPARATLTQYRVRLQRLLDESGASGRFSERETRASQSLERALQEYDQRAELPLSGFLALLDELLGVLTISVDPAAKSGVEFHSPLAVYGARYQHVFILGAAEGVLPAPLSNDPLLDFFERDLIRAHGLPLEDALEAAERETLSFVAAVQTAETTLTTTYPELLENREQLPSPFFALLGTEPSAPDPRPAASGLERLLLTLREEPGAAHHAWQVEARRESEAPPDEYDGIIGVPFDIQNATFSATQLAALGQCAFRWFGQRLLHLAEPEEAEEDVSPLLLGNLYHKTLELVAQRAWDEVGKSAASTPEAEKAQGWDEAATADFRQSAVDHLDTAFSEAQTKVGTPRAATWPLQRREHLEKLARVIRAADFLLPQTEVVKLEGKFEGSWRGFRVRGQVDRVDDGPNGLVLTDYKTGKSLPMGAKNSKGEPKLDLQLPLYVETAAPHWFGDDHEVATARYYSINAARTLRESTSDEEELRAFVERVMTILQLGDFPVDPDVEQSVCAYCELDAVCRRGPRLGRKRQAASRDIA